MKKTFKEKLGRLDKISILIDKLYQKDNFKNLSAKKRQKRVYKMIEVTTAVNDILDETERLMEKLK